MSALGACIVSGFIGFKGIEKIPVAARP